MRQAFFWITDRSIIKVTGKDSKTFLDRILTNDILNLGAGKGCHTCLCSNKGKVLADFYVYAFLDHLVMNCDVSLKDKILSELQRYIIMEDIQFEDVYNQHQGLILIGEDISEVLRENSAHEWSHFKKRWGYPALEIWAKPNALTPFVQKLSWPLLSPEEQEECRIESMTPKYGIDITEENIPQEANLYDAISFTKGCYIGQETIARLQNRGHVNKTLVLFKLSGNAVPKPNTKITLENGEEAGFVTSSIFSKKFQAVISMGYVKYLYRQETAFKINSYKAERIAC